MTENTYRITDLRACEVLDCRGLPTVQVQVELDGQHQGIADVPAGRSTGKNDAFISDLSVGIAAEQIKTGASARGERTSKYNRILAIEAELGAAAKYGSGHLRPEGS